MEIYLVRHTTPNIEKGICYGQSDLELADSFSEEAQEVIKELPREFDGVYSSPLKRCSQLAELIEPNYIIDARLMELNFGDWELKKWEDIPIEEIQPWYDDFVNIPSTNGESYQELYKRSVSFLEEVKQANLSSIIIITHAGCMRSILAHTLGIPLKESFKRIKLNYGSIERVVI